MAEEDKSVLPVERIERAILVLRGERVILDSEISLLYEVETRALIQAMKRNPDRFPPDFAFQLTLEEVESLGDRLGGTSPGRGGRRFRPYAFTEQGVAMLSSVLRTERAVRVNVEVMRVFVRLRHVVSSQAEVIRRLDEMEQKYDAQFGAVFDALRELMAPPESARKQIGFGGL